MRHEVACDEWSTGSQPRIQVCPRSLSDAFTKLNESLFPLVTGMRMLKQFEHGNDVCSLYEMDLKSPAGISLTLNSADWVVVHNGKMVEERIYYDVREFATAFGR